MTTIKLPFSVRAPILACGADLKGAFAVAQGRRAVLETGFGDLADADNFTRYEKAVRRAARVSRAAGPRIIACDLHPGYFSTRVAESLQRVAPGAKLCRVQHHEAHVAGAIADHGLTGAVIGVAFDGTGYGADGAVWGGEFFAGNVKRLARVGHLAYMPMPGGEMAIREPWRMAAAYLYRAFGDRWTKLPLAMARGVDRAKWRFLKKMIDGDVRAPLTSSAGRLFDAAGSIILARYRAAREAELPVALERLASRAWADAYGFDIRDDGGMAVADVAGVMRGMAADLAKKTDPGVVAGRFHTTVAEIIARMCVKLRRERRTDTVVLSGGVFMNRIVTDRTVFLLGVEGFKAYHSARVATTDAGIPIGQIAIAGARASCV